MTSSLASKADRLASHLRWTKDSDGWGGDEDVVLSEIDTFKARVEWVEGTGSSWNVWIFDEDADLQEEDILIFPVAGLALTISRVATFTKLNGTFHHYELVTEEHEKSVGDLLAALP